MDIKENKRIIEHMLILTKISHGNIINFSQRPSQGEANFIRARRIYLKGGCTASFLTTKTLRNTSPFMSVKHASTRDKKKEP